MDHKKLVEISQICIRRIIATAIVFIALFAIFHSNNPWTADKLPQSYKVLEFDSSTVPVESQERALEKSIEVITSRMTLMGISEFSIRAIRGPKPAIMITASNDALDQSKIELISKIGRFTFHDVFSATNNKNNRREISYVSYNYLLDYSNRDIQYMLSRESVFELQDISSVRVNTKPSISLELKFHRSGIAKLRNHPINRIVAVVDNFVIGEVAWSQREDQGYLFHSNSSINWAKDLEILARSGPLPYAVQQRLPNTIDTLNYSKLQRKLNEKEIGRNTFIVMLVIIVAILASLLFISSFSTISMILLTIINLIVITGALSLLKTKMNRYGLLAVMTTLSILYALYGRFLMTLRTQLIFSRDNDSLMTSLASEHNRLALEFILINLIVGSLSLFGYFFIYGSISCFCVTLVISLIASSLTSWAINCSIIKRIFKIFLRNNA